MACVFTVILQRKTLHFESPFDSQGSASYAFPPHASDFPDLNYPLYHPQKPATKHLKA